MYAKFIDKYKIEYAPNPLRGNDGFIYINPTAEQYLANGYKPLTTTEQPIEEDYYFIPTYTETETEIVQGWERQEISNAEKVAILKQKLADTDYIAIKYAEGRLTQEEYAPYGEQREQWRIEIRELENRTDEEVGELYVR